MDNKYLKLVLKVLSNTQKASTNQLVKDNLGSIIEIETEDIASQSVPTANEVQKVALTAPAEKAPEIQAPAPAQSEVQSATVSAPVELKTEDLKIEGE